jgi:hypothetical protein
MSTMHPDVADQIAKLKERALEIAARPLPPMSDEQLERERWQYESNAYAERCPMYAVARATSMHHAVIPLEPLGTEPLVSPSEATRDERAILKWWASWPEANVGVPIGRANNVIAVHVEDMRAAKRLRRLAAFEVHDPDNDVTYIEHRDLNAASSRLIRPTSIVARQFSGWGKEPSRRLREKYERELPPEGFTLLWSYPPIGLDAHDFPARRVTLGVNVLGPNEILPWGESRLEGLKVVAPPGPLPEIPQWLASMIGKPRSRRAMKAAQEAYEAIWRDFSAPEVLKLQAARERAMGAAKADLERAKTALAKAEAEDTKGEPLPPVLDDDKDEEGWE